MWSQCLKTKKIHIPKEAHWHFSFLIRLSYEVPQSQKQNTSAKNSQSTTFGGSPFKQGRALIASVLVWLVLNFRFKIHKYWIFSKATSPLKFRVAKCPTLHRIEYNLYNAALFFLWLHALLACLVELAVHIGLIGTALY